MDDTSQISPQPPYMTYGVYRARNRRKGLFCTTCAIPIARIDRLHGLSHSILSRLPAELQVKWVSMVEDPNDLIRLGKSCRAMADVAAKTWNDRVNDYVERFGIKSGSEFLDTMNDCRAVMAGPGTLAILDPRSVASLEKTGYHQRMELHVPCVFSSIARVEKALTEAGFSLEIIVVSPYQIGRWAEQVLGYVKFGITVARIYNYIKYNEDGVLQSCTVYANHSLETGMPSVAELPSTLFMNYVYGGCLTVMYPNLTLRGIGIINNDLDDRDEDWFAAAFASSGLFEHVRCLNDVPGYEEHNCVRTLSCPSRVREEFDGISARINLQVMKWGRSPFKTRYPYFSWKLKCTASCVDATAFWVRGVYAYMTARYTASKDTWEHGYWRQEWYEVDEEDLDSDDDLSVYYGDEDIPEELHDPYPP